MHFIVCVSHHMTINGLTSLCVKLSVSWKLRINLNALCFNQCWSELGLQMIFFSVSTLTCRPMYDLCFRIADYDKYFILFCVFCGSNSFVLLLQDLVSSCWKAFSSVWHYHLVNILQVNLGMLRSALSKMQPPNTPAVLQSILLKERKIFVRNSHSIRKLFNMIQIPDASWVNWCNIILVWREVSRSL